MNCTNCGKVVDQNDKFCANCGTPIKKISDPSPIPKQKGSTIQVGEDNVKVEHTENTQKVFKFFFLSIFVALIVGALTYYTTGQILGINETDIRAMDFPSSYRITSDRNVVGLWKNYVESEAYDNAKIASIISFIIALGYSFLKVEKVNQQDQ